MQYLEEQVMCRILLPKERHRQPSFQIRWYSLSCPKSSFVAFSLIEESLDGSDCVDRFFQNPCNKVLLLLVGVLASLIDSVLRCLVLGLLDSIDV